MRIEWTRIEPTRESRSLGITKGNLRILLDRAAEEGVFYDLAKIVRERVGDLGYAAIRRMESTPFQIPETEDACLVDYSVSIPSGAKDCDHFRLEICLNNDTQNVQAYGDLWSEE